MLATNEDWIELKKEIEKDRGLAEIFLLDYEERLKKYSKDKEEFLSQSKGHGSGGRGNLPGDPTASAAMASAAYDEKQEDYYWLKAVEIVQRGLGEKKNMFLKIRRKLYREFPSTRSRGWVTPTQSRFSDAIERRFFDNAKWVSESTVKRYWKGLVQSVVDIRMRLVKKKEVKH